MAKRSKSRVPPPPCSGNYPPLCSGFVSLTRAPPFPVEGSLGASPPLASIFIRSQVCLCSVAGKNTRETLVRRPALSRSVSNAFNYCDGLSRPRSMGPESPGANIPMFSVRVWSPLFTLFLLLPLPSCPRKNSPRDRIIRCLVLLRSILCPLLPRPFTLAQKKTVLCSTQKHALSWKVPERSSILGCQSGFPLLQNSRMASLASFRPSPTRHSLPDSWNVREILGLFVCPIGRFQPFAAPRMPLGWA